MENTGNKKTLILSILGVLLLVIAVVGVSFAMYTFSATGTKENVIQTGSVSISYDDTAEGGAADAGGVLSLTNQYPMTDANGIAQTGEGNVLAFTVAAEINGTMTIKYDLGFDAITEGTTLTDDMIKFVMYKQGNETPILGTATTGVTVASRASVAGPNNYITTYGLTGGTFTATGKDMYTIKAWVSEEYDLPTDGVQTEGTTQSGTTKSETFSFKVKVVAKQA